MTIPECLLINPYYFDLADLKIDCLVQSGLIPCIFGCWGHYMQWLGLAKIRKHWRYIIARWGAYPVIWCMAGEARQPHYSLDDDSPKRLEIISEQQKKWTEIATYVRSNDPFKRLITIHPCPGDGSWASKDVLKDSKLFDIDMLQTDHFGKNILELSLKKLQESLETKPTKPVINSEVCYEGIAGTNWQETQRFLFWSHILSGAAGHTYGAEGVWNFKKEMRYENKANFSDTHWVEAMSFLGSYQIGLGKKFLENFEWNKFESHPEWVIPHWTETDIFLPYCVGIPESTRIIYIPAVYFHLWDSFKLKEIKIIKIERNINYQAYYFNPRTGITSEIMDVMPNKSGEWVLPISFQSLSPAPTVEDWLLVLESKK